MRWSCPLVARGMSTGDLQAHLAEVYGTQRVAPAGLRHHRRGGRADGRVAEPAAGPGLPVVFIDAINVKIRDGQVANRPIYVALAVTCDGEREVLGLWAGEHRDGEGRQILVAGAHRDPQPRRSPTAASWSATGSGPARRGRRGLARGGRAGTASCTLLRGSFRYASKRDWAAIARDLKPVYTAASEADALDRFVEFGDTWAARYPAIIRLWENAWAEFVPFLAFDREIRTVICTTTPSSR